MSSLRGYSSNSGLLPSRPVFGGADDSKTTSSSSLTEQLELRMDSIMNTYLSESLPQDKAECVNRLSLELSKPLLGHHHHSNRHERISIILNRIVTKSQENIQILSMICAPTITNLLVKWLKGESLPHGYSGVNTKKAIMILLPNILHKAYSIGMDDWPLEFVTAYLWDVTYDGHWHDRPECICFTRIIRSILCDTDLLNTNYAHFRKQLATPFLSRWTNVKKEAMFKYDTIKNDQITKFRLAMELCCYQEIRKEVYLHIDKWFNLQNIQPHFQIKFINKMFCSLQPEIYNDEKLFSDKLLRLNYGMHCKVALTNNLTFLFESFPKFYDIAINFILNIKPSEKTKFQLLLECIVDATPANNLDLSQSRRKRKKLNHIDLEWRDSYALTNEDDEDEDDDEEEVTCIKIDHPSYKLGTNMALAREVHSHRKMCDETLKKFINVHKFALCLFCESYLEHISEKSTTKVKKNGLTYLNNMAKHLIRAQYFMYRECKRDQNEIIEWKLQLMAAHNIITQSFVPLSQHFGFDNVCSLLFNFLLLSIYNGSQDKQKMLNVKLIHFEDVITINEQKKSFQSIPVAMETLDTLFNIHIQSTGLERTQIEQYLCLISLLLERGLRFVCQYKDKNKHKNKKHTMLYALYTDNNSGATIEDLLTKAMGISKYFVPSTLNVTRCINYNNSTGLTPSDVPIIDKYIHKLGHIDFFMEILLIFTLFGCMSLPRFLDVLLEFPTTSHLIHMLILQQFELPFSQSQIDIDYEKHEQTLHTFCYHFIAKDESDVTESSPSKKGKTARVLRKNMVKNLTIVMYEDRLWNVPKSIIAKLAHFESQFCISAHLWKYYLNHDRLRHVLSKYDYEALMPSYIRHISRDIGMIHESSLNDPILIAHAIFRIVAHQDKDDWRCLFELLKRIRIMFEPSNRELIASILNNILSFDCVNTRHSFAEMLDFPHLIFSAICQKTTPYVECNAMKIQLSSNRNESVNPCKWLFDLAQIEDYFVDVFKCIMSLLHDQQYTHLHLNGYIHFAAQCISHKASHDGIRSIIYEFIIAICEALLSYPLAFASLLEDNNMDSDIQHLVQYAMQQARTTEPKSNSILLLSIRDGDVCFECPVDVIVCMLYIIAYCNAPLNGISPWIDFIVTKELKLKIACDEIHLPQQLRWKLLLQRDNAQLYRFVYQICDAQSLAKIIPFLLDHKFESSVNQMLNWLRHDLSDANGRFVDKTSLFAQIMTTNKECAKSTVPANVPMIMALFTDEKESNDDDEVVMNDFAHESSSFENEAMLQCLVAAFNCADNTMNSGAWGTLMTQLFCIESEQDKAHIICTLLEQMWSNSDYAVAVTNLVNNHTEYLERLLCYCNEEMRNKYGMNETDKEHESDDDSVKDWLSVLSGYSNTRKRKWSENLDFKLLHKLGGFGNDFVHNLLQNTSDDALRYKILAELMASRTVLTAAAAAAAISLELKSVRTSRDLHHLFDYNHVPCGEAVQMVLDVWRSGATDELEEPPKKKAKKALTVVAPAAARHCYAEFVADKLSDDPTLFALLLMDSNGAFVEQCIECMCNYLYSPVRGLFMVNQLHLTLIEHPHLVVNVINVLAKHCKERLWKQDLLRNREDWYFHHFAMLLCSIKIENEYDLDTDVIHDLIDCICVFLENSPSQIQHLNQSIYLASRLLINLSKHYFHFFPNPHRMQKLADSFKATKMQKMWSLMQSLDRFYL
eukprot:844299_1